jgi:putative hydrolase of HD superfamily
MKQAHAAELLGVTQSTVSRIERGELKPTGILRNRLLDLVSARVHPARDAALRRLIDAVGTATQAAREAVAARRLFGMLPTKQATEILALWNEFETAATADARFAKAIDRLQPILLNHAVGGGTWTDYDVDEARERALTCRIADGSPALWGAAEAFINDAVCRGWLRPAPGT